MKTTILLLLLIGTVSASAQGTVNIITRNTTVGVNAVITYTNLYIDELGPIANGSKPSGVVNIASNGYNWGGINARAGLYAGPLGTPVDQLELLAPAVGFRTGAAGGYVDVGSVAERSVLSVPPGGQALVQFRAWDAGIPGVDSWDAARTISTERYIYMGRSAVLTITLGGTEQNPLPANLTGLPPFDIGYPGYAGLLDVSTNPITQAVLEHATTSFSVKARGEWPLRYQWWFNGGMLSGETNSLLTLSNIQPTHAGEYWVTIVNSSYSVTSSPAILHVKTLLARSGGTNLYEPRCFFLGSAELELHTAYTNGSIFYTLDGSTPSFFSKRYLAPITLRQTATLRAVAYSADFLQSAEALPMEIIIIPIYTLFAETQGGGNIAISPGGGPYTNGTVITLTATPINGWTFLGWAGDASGANTEIMLTMDRNKCVEAVFGTTLQTPTAGNGTLLRDPNVEFYPYGTTVRLNAMPQAGNCFAVWGSSASGATNPLQFVISQPNPTISCLFTPLTAGQYALTVMAYGNGRVARTPPGNVFQSGHVISLTAVPDPGEDFLGWTGDESGTALNISITMNQSKIITATFTRKIHLDIFNCLGGYDAEDFRSTFAGALGNRYSIYSSSNLVNWSLDATATNTLGKVQFSDPMKFPEQRPSNNIPRFYRVYIEP